MGGEVHRDAWYGCYAYSLRTLLAPAVPAHPAKMAWGLALRLLAHVKAEGWLPAWGRSPRSPGREWGDRTGV